MNIFSKKETSISNNPRQFDEVRGEVFDRFSKVLVEKNRTFLLNMLLVTAVIVLGLSIRYMLPLEKVVPYTVSRDINGSYKADFSAFKAYKPDDVQIESQARDLAKSMYTILSYKDAVENLETAKSQFVGKAMTQFAQWFQDDQPTITIKDNPDYTRTVEITSSALLPNNVVIVRFKTTSSLKDESPTIKNLVLTTKYIISPRKTRQEALENSTGLFFEHFTVDTEK